MSIYYRRPGDGFRGMDRVEPRNSGFPAHAGMDPLVRDALAIGGGRGPGGHLRPGFPAHAGMDPAPRRWTVLGFPRTRGDGPAQPGPGGVKVGVSPAGMDPSATSRRHGLGFPAHAGMDPIHQPEWAQALVSPHTRGWTPHRAR